MKKRNVSDDTPGTFDIVLTHLAVQAMRDNGYRNAAYAIAELMDNAIQAGATDVELLCAERTAQVNQRFRTRVEQIAVLDNGCGAFWCRSQKKRHLLNHTGFRLDSPLQGGYNRDSCGLSI